MQTVLVTGAEGYIGERLVQHLLRNGLQVVAGVRNRARKLALERTQIPALVCDITDPINVARTIASTRPDAVVHLAGISTAAAAAADPLAAYQSIVSSWAHILDGVRRAVPRARVLLTSAADVYGSSTDHSPINEFATPNPVSTFGSLKLAAESIADTFYRDYHLDLVIARPFQFVGPALPNRFFMGYVAERLAAWDTPQDGQTFQVPDLDCQRDYLHIDDAVRALALILTDGQPHECYNVCSGTALTCRDAIATIAHTRGLALTLETLPTGDGDPQIQTLVGDNTRLRALGWTPQRTAADGLAELARTVTPARTSVGAGVGGM